VAISEESEELESQASAGPALSPRWLIRAKRKSSSAKRGTRKLTILKVLGPGLITGAADFKAKAFYAVLALSTLLGLLLNFAGVNPIRALILSAIINGVTAAPIMAFMMLMSSNRKVMGKFVLPTYLKVLGWGATVIMALAAVGMVWPTGK
jgi:Mn2+/Fe2+ NRAMP family transporter